MITNDIRPKVSVIVPVYGTEEYFDRCMKSLLHQTLEQIEIVVVNDGSGGNIKEVIKEYETDNRVKFLNNDINHGLLRARVQGSLVATGDYIAFLDSDDYVSFDYYRSLLNKAEREESDITIGKTVWVENDNKYVYNLHEANFHFDSLIGDDIKKTFFGQEYQCYSWHTVWNKLYKRELWNKCIEEFKAVSEHIVMTEDIFFSTLLFFNSKKVVRIDNEAYFYCVNDGASTNAKQISCERFIKNVKDISFVFDSVANYLKKQNAESYVMRGVKAGRDHYADMWSNLAFNVFSGEDKEKALEAVKNYRLIIEKHDFKDAYFFESIRTPWNGGLEYIKQQIWTCSQEYISFDIFDTLVKRPFYEPQDIFKLLDKYFYDKTGNDISFSALRVEAEQCARNYYGAQLSTEEITLNEIYDYIVMRYGVKRSIALEMMDLEQSHEIQFCEPRKAGVELLELAKASGKKVVLISDMYLGKNVVGDILRKCGVTQYEKLYLSSEERCLKYNGHLFLRALSDLKISSDNILHIGDSWRSDIEGSHKVGITSIFFPRTIEVFENKICGCITNRCSELGRDVCGDYIDYKSIKSNLGFRCMQAIVANEYFDNPYRSFSSESDLNSDPFLIGYYPMGMHISGIAKWIDFCVKKINPSEIYFLARDGYLPMKAYQKYAKDKSVTVKYIQASRKALLPIMLKEAINFYQLPIEYKAHSPRTLMEVLAPFTKEIDYVSVINNEGIMYEENFSSIEDYHQFIKIFLKDLYDGDKHEREKTLVRQYYLRFIKDGIAFDLGYSGRIQAAICDSINRSVDALFLHEDFDNSTRLKENRRFEIHSFYGYRPTVTGLIREHLLSDYSGSCIGFHNDGENVVPVIETREKKYSDRFVVDTIQVASLAFLDEFVNWFKDTPVFNAFSHIEVSVPLEGFLRKPSKADIKLFSGSYFEDVVYGARTEINIEEFITNELRSIGWVFGKVEEEETSVPSLNISPEDARMLDLINKSAQWKRAVAWLLMDRSLFWEKLVLNINRLLNH